MTDVLNQNKCQLNTLSEIISPAHMNTTIFKNSKITNEKAYDFTTILLFVIVLIIYSEDPYTIGFKFNAIALFLHL